MAWRHPGGAAWYCFRNPFLPGEYYSAYEVSIKIDVYGGAWKLRIFGRIPNVQELVLCLLKKTAVTFITKFLAEVWWHKVSRVIVCQYQKQHVRSWPGVQSYFCGTGSGSGSACLISRKPPWLGDVTCYLPKKWMQWAHLGDKKSEGVVGVGPPFWAAAAATAIR